MTEQKAELVAALAELERADLETLRDKWQARYGPPPTHRSPGLLRLMLAWRMQTEALGGLDPATRRALRRPVTEADKPLPATGTRLVRLWRGAEHEAVALEGGRYLYAGRRYASLSQVARAITGTRWNGPRFFGLRETPR